MSKGLRTAAMIVGAVALVATGVGAAAGFAASAAAGGGAAGAAAAASATAFGISAATLTTIGTIATVGAGLLSLGAALTAKKPGAGSYERAGSPEEFTFDHDGPDPGLAYPMSSEALVRSRTQHAPDKAVEATP